MAAKKTAASGTFRAAAPKKSAAEQRREKYEHESERREEAKVEAVGRACAKLRESSVTSATRDLADMIDQAIALRNAHPTDLDVCFALRTAALTFERLKVDLLAKENEAHFVEARASRAEREARKAQGAA